MCAWVCFIWPTESHMTPRPVVALYTCIPTDYQCNMHDVEIKGMCWWDKRLDGTAVDAAFRVLGLELAVYCMHRPLCAYLHACMYTYYKDIYVLLAWHTAVPRRLQLCAYVYICSPCVCSLSWTWTILQDHGSIMVQPSKGVFMMVRTSRGVYYTRLKISN